MKKIRLYTKGKLGVPAELMVQNYTVESVSKLTMLDSENYLDIMEEILKQVLGDEGGEIVPNLTEQEIREIQLNVYCLFWSNRFLNYACDVTLDSGEKKSVCLDFDLSKVEVQSLPEEIQDGFKIESGEDVVVCEYPKWKHIRHVQNLISERFSDYLESRIGGGRVDTGAEKEMQSYKNLMLFYSCIRTHNGKEYLSVEDVESVVRNLDGHLFLQFQMKLLEFRKYGVPEEFEGVEVNTKKVFRLRGLL